jgi:hypothetical protein
MESGKESSSSTADHDADGNPTSLHESREGGGIHKQILFGNVRFWSVLYRNVSWGGWAGTKDSIHR